MNKFIGYGILNKIMRYYYLVDFNLVTSILEDLGYGAHCVIAINLFYKPKVNTFMHLPYVFTSTIPQLHWKSLSRHLIYF